MGEMQYDVSLNMKIYLPCFLIVLPALVNKVGQMKQNSQPLRSMLDKRPRRSKHLL